MKNDYIRQSRPFAALLLLLGMALSFAANPSFAATPNYGLGADVDGWTFDSRSRILTYYPSPSAGACRANCQNNPNCAAYSWVKPGGYRAGDQPMCYLIATAGPVVPTSCCISASKSAMTTTSPGGNTGGNGLGADVDGWTFDSRSRILGYYQSPSASACRAHCQGNANCAAYSWVKPGGYRAGDPPVCYLIATAGPVVPSSCCISASKTAMTTSEPPPQNPGTTGNLTGAWRLTTSCTWTNPAWGATVNLSQGAGGALTATTANDQLNSVWQAPDPAPGSWGTKMKSQVIGSVFNLVLHPNGWLSVLEFTGTVNGSRIDGRIHHYTTDDCNFTMTRQ